MAGGKQTPRQRMIGILYLVLLGLIALNVPDNLLDAFKKIADSLDTSSKNVTADVSENFTAFENGPYKDQYARAKPIHDTAVMARDAADKLSNYVDTLRALLIKEGGGINPDINDVNARDNLDISDRLMIQDKRADQLKLMINDTRGRLISLLRVKDRAGVQLSLNTDDPPPGAGQKKTWQEAYFGEGVPLGATLTNLAKIKADTKNAENEVVKKILAEAEKAQVNLDQFNAVAVAPTSYVLVGQAYTASVFLTAYDSKLNPTITITGGGTVPVEAGMGKYSGSTSSEGLHTWSATIDVKQTDGTMKHYTTPQQTYMVARPSAVVSPDKMNVLYIGLPNPLSVSAPGVAAKDLHVSISSGSLTGSNGHYEAQVKGAGTTTTVTVSGELTKGKVSVLGSTLFRVKRIPDPKAIFGGKSGGNVATANLRAQDRVFARLENFEFDAQFRITHFTLIVVRPRQDPVSYSASGNELTAQMRQVMSGLLPGSTVVFDDITTVGPDGTPRPIDPIVMRAN